MTFLSILEVSPQFLTLPVDTTVAEIQAHESGAPDGLGRGAISTTNLLLAQLASVAAAEREPLNDIFLDFDFVDDRSSFASKLTWSAKAKFGFSGGSASARASMTASYRRSNRRVDMVLIKVVQKEKWFLRDPEARPEALALLAQPEDYLRRYGDQIVRAVIRGGMMALVYRFEFNDMQSATEFRASAKANWGGGSASASLAISMLQTATNTSLSVQGVCLGVDNAPPVFVPSTTVDQKTGQIDSKDPLVTELAQYFQNFEESVTPASAASMSFDIMPQSNIANIPAAQLPDLQQYTDLIETAAELDDQIDFRLAELDYLKNVALAWNPHVTIEEIEAMQSELLRKSEELEEAVKTIGRMESASLPFTADEMPALPKNWTARDLKLFSSASFRARFGSATTVSRSLDLPPLYPGQHVKIDIALSVPQSIFNKGGSVIYSWEHADKTKEEFTSHGVDAQTRSNSRSLILVPPSGTEGIVADAKINTTLGIIDAFVAIYF